MAQAIDVHTDRPISNEAKQSQNVLHQLLDEIRRLDRTGYLSTEDQRVHAGLGGYGDVYIAYLRIGKKKIKVALKQLRVFLYKEPRFAKFLAKEMRVWSRLHHPNILEFLGYILEENGIPSLISEWMENGTALAFVKAHPETDLLRLVLGIGQGLEYLHSQDVVHSDLKSDNVLVSEAGVPLICDFGASRMLAASQTLGGSTTSGRLQGSMRWLAAELFDDRAAHTKESDVWAFGMTAYELLVEDRPYYHIRYDFQIYSAITKGEKPRQPEGLDAASDAISDIWHICNNCWTDEITSRWSISDVVAFLTSQADAYVRIEKHAWVNPVFSSTSSGHIGSSNETSGQLYDTYDKALSKSLIGAPSTAIVRSILAIVYVTASTAPLPMKAITAFLRCDPQFSEENVVSVRRVIRSLSDVLYVNKRKAGAVQTRQASFLDFLKTKMELEGWDSPSRVHKIMFNANLSLMLSKLRFNICGLEDASLMNKDVADLDQRISECIPPELDYSCQHWFIHLRSSGLSAAEAQEMVSRLLCDVKVLFWLEVLSITRGAERSIPILQQCSALFEEFENIFQASHEVSNLVSSFSEAFESAPHIYLSALPWLPQKSRTYSNTATSFRHLLLITEKDDDWRASIWWNKRAESEVRSVAYSPDGEFIVSGFRDNTIRVWNAHTGATVGEPLRGHEGTVRSVAFSPDGGRIVSGSEDNTVRMWNAHTGAPVGELLQGHKSWVTSVAFSPDGGHIVSGSADTTIRVWDAHTGVPVGEPLRGHENVVWSVAFSPDGGRIVSGSADTTIRVWDAHTGAPVGEPLQDHERTVWSVGFSPDGGRIVSGSEDRTIRVWDAHTGAPVGEPLRGHERAVESVAFSPDGDRIVSGSLDSTIRLWDSRTGEAVGEPLLCHSNGHWVRSVAFSPDGRQVVSGSSDMNIFVTTLADPERDDWNRMCRSMDVTDGWVKDDNGKVLLWIPGRYRRYFKHNIAVWIRDGRLDNVPPVVNLDILKEYSGSRWTRIYEEGDKD